MITIIKNSLTGNSFYAIVTIVFALFANVSVAKDYKIEVLIFQNQEDQRAYESKDYVEPTVLETEAITWPLEPSMLLEQAEALNVSNQYRLMQHLSWGQESLPLSLSAAYRVDEAEINGWIKIYAKDLLFANLDLDYLGYRMFEKRRLKLNEKHFFDHPKFGVLLQVSRLEVEPTEVTEELPTELPTE